MSRDYSLLHTAGPDTAFLRFYTWSPPCLSFGRNEPALRRYDRSEIERLELSVVRRPTGGRAVWHDRELTYSVAAPVSAFGSLQDSYYAIHQLFDQTLRSLGIDTRLAGRPEKTPSLDAGACFTSPVGGEVLVGGLKVLGSAQLREGLAFLQHGSLLIGGSKDVITRVSRRKSTVSGATTLEAATGRSFNPLGLAGELANTARERWSGNWGDAARIDVQESEIDFRDANWTWRK